MSVICKTKTKATGFEKFRKLFPKDLIADP